MYHYYLYGIGFESDFKLYDIAETECTAQVSIKRISEGFDDEEMRQKHINYKILENGVWFSNSYGQFFILDGNRIEVLPSKKADDLILSTFICGWGMAFLFAQRHFSAIHCTALEVRDGCVLISGGSGAGKSTTAMELISRGYRYLADDIAMVSNEDDCLIQPAFPMQKICRDVAERLEENVSLLYIDPDKDKFAKKNTEDFCGEPRKLKTVFLLNKGNVSEVSIEEVTGLNKYLRLLSCLFLSEMYIGPGLPKEEQFRMLKIAEKVRVYSITRPEQGNTLTEVVNLIEKWS